MKHQYVSEHFPTERSARAKIVLGVLADKFPACFVIYERRRRPLKIGIDANIAALDGAISLRDLRLALAYYTRNVGYLRNTVAGADRIDLAGHPAGVVTPEEAAHTAERLQQQITKRRHVPARIEPTDFTSPIAESNDGAVASGRLSLSDLKLAAAARRQNKTPAAAEAHFDLTSTKPASAMRQSPRLNSLSAC